MNSCLYECSVFHRRLRPIERQFTYRIFMFALDLDELDAIAGRVPLFSHNRRNCYSFRDGDHLNLGKATLKENIVEYLRQNDVPFPEGGRILLVTLPRVFGYIFNPVSFYFCYDAAGEAVCAVTEVENTFREMKPFLIGDRNAEGRFHRRATKHFYVSPFMDLDLEFDFRLAVPGTQLDVHIDDFDKDGLILTSHLGGTRKPLTTATLLWLTFKYPFITLKVIFLIHWQAMKLWLARLPHHAKAASPGDQREVLHPHRSIAGKVL